MMKKNQIGMRRIKKMRKKNQIGMRKIGMTETNRISAGGIGIVRRN